jgi:zinc-ribbon domain
MPDQFCPTCGTEVDADARFCPTCGTVLTEDAPQAELPPAPSWPEPEAQPAPAPSSEPEGEPSSGADEEPEEQLTLQAGEPPEQAADGADAPTDPAPGEAPPAPTARNDATDLPVTWPTTLSGWLIGLGAVLGALALLASLSDGVSLLLFLALIGVAATVFLADRLPEIPRLRLLILSVSLVGLGVAFERAGFGARGADSILLVAMISAAGGALLVELDRDRPLPPPAP